MGDIESMADDVLLGEFENLIDRGEYDRADAMRAEILRRMDSDARRVDILPDGHCA